MFAYLVAKKAPRSCVRKKRRREHYSPMEREMEKGRLHRTGSTEADIAQRSVAKVRIAVSQPVRHPRDVVQTS